MNKYLLITGIGILFLSDVLSQTKITHSNHLQGAWNSWYHPERMLDSGKLERAVPHGEWKSWYPDGSLRTIRTYHAAKLASVKNEIRRKNARNTFFVITDIAKRDVAAARHLLTPAYSFHSLGHSHTSHTGATGQQAVSLEKRVTYNVYQSAYLPPFTECLHHGLYINFFPGGQVKDSGFYKNGVRDGLWKEWNADATVLATGIYKRGKPYGDWRYFNKQGKLLYVHWYNESGKLKEKVRLKG